MLSYYARYFSTVEINATFYRLQSGKTLLGWKQTVPDHFIFSVKGSRYTTHMKKLNDPAKSVQKFIDQVRVLGDKVGPILFQLPPRWHKDVDRLAAFLKVLPRQYRYAFEFRDPTWFDDDVFSLLKRNQMACCIYDLEHWISPIHLGTDFVYLRLHGPGKKYTGNYTRELLEPWKEKLVQWTDEGMEVYCYFNNDFKAYAPHNALLLLEMLD